MNPRRLLPLISLLPLLPLALSACSTTGSMRWDPYSVSRIAVLPGDVAIYKAPDLATPDPEYSGAVSQAVAQAVATVFRQKGYKVEDPAETARRIAADPAQQSAWNTLKERKWELDTGTEPMPEQAALLASAAGVDLVVLPWGRGDWRAPPFSASLDLAAVPITPGMHEETPQHEWRNLVRVDLAVVDSKGVVRGRFFGEEINYATDPTAYEGPVRTMLSTAPAKATGVSEGGGGYGGHGMY